MMELPMRNASYQTTVKCSTCTADVELGGLADHVCSRASSRQDTNVPAHSRYVASPTSDDMPLADEPAHTPEVQPFHPPRRGASLFRRDRPSLPRLDSAGSTRRALDPKEAASIAHDLGLPSPLSAGSGRRSPRANSSRKNSKTRIGPGPRSPELPISQDCAFPPFPMSKPKPKRAHTDRDISLHNAPPPASRSVSRTKTYDTFVSHSPSSSTQSGGSSGMVKRRTSESSSYQRSGQSTTEDTPSAQSTAPSSPRLSADDNLSSSKSSLEIVPPLPALEPSRTGSPHETSYNVSPATPLWSLPKDPYATKSIDPSTGEDRSENGMSTLNHDKEDRILPESEEGSNPAVTFDAIVLPGQPGSDEALTEKKPREPSYRAKRPPPLLETKTFDESQPRPPISARAPTVPLTGGLARTFTNLFGRKRSQSTSSKRIQKLDVNSPRLRALAPEPPSVPQRGDGEFGIPKEIHDTYFTEQPESQRPLNGDVDQDHMPPPVSEEVAIPIDSLSHDAADDTVEATEKLRFNFSFGDDSTLEDEIKTKEVSLDRDVHKATIEIPRVQQVSMGEDLRRVSIDSASSYGSIGFSNRTTSSRSSLPPLEDVISKLSTDPDPVDNAITSVDILAPLRTRTEMMAPDSPTDPLYFEGRLSPVSTTNTVPWPNISELRESPIEEAQQSSIEDTRKSSVESSRQPIFEEAQTRPVVNKHEESEEVRKITTEEAQKSPVKELGESPIGPFMLPPRLDSAPQASPIERPSSRRPSTPGNHRGSCRGCSQLILTGQKSVSSKDGRLTGRYHKDCFACRTCKQPFATADFYVHNDQPYCSHDYHALNNTLCRSCGLGIEGQYLETFDTTGQESKKFHSKCLACSTCRVQLGDDYFEYQGRIYCERDAFRAANGPKSPYDNAPSRPSPLVREYISSGQPPIKGRFPERRITRLMMT